MAFPRLYDDQTCPIAGYEGYALRVLVNPTGAEKTDWALGHLGIDGCAECAKLQPIAGTSKTPTPRRWCAACAEARARLGRAAVAVFGTSHTEGFDFSTPENALATFAQDMPDELLAWLYMLPASLWAARSDDLKKKLLPSLTTPTS